MKEIVFPLALQSRIPDIIAFFYDGSRSVCSTGQIVISIIKRRFPMISQRNFKPRLPTEHHRFIIFFPNLRLIAFVFGQFELRLIVHSPSIMIDMNFYDIFHSRRIGNFQIWPGKCHTAVLHHIWGCQHAYFMLCHFHLICLRHITHIISFFIHPKSIRYFHLIVSLLIVHMLYPCIFAES